VIGLGDAHELLEPWTPRVSARFQASGCYTRTGEPEALMTITAFRPVSFSLRVVVQYPISLAQNPLGKAMRRRDLIKGIAGSAAWPLVAHAQSTTGIPTVGVLWHAGGPQEEQPYFDALMQGFKDVGYVEGRNIRFEHRFPNEIPDRFRQMAAELVALKVSVIVTVGNVTAPYAKEATAAIPIVFLFVADPVASKLVSSLARPGGNVTGQALLGTDLNAKRFELLRELVPHLSRVGFLLNPAEPSAAAYLKEGQAAAAALGLTVMPFELRSLDEMQGIFERITRAAAQALVLGPGGLLFQGRSNIAKLALMHGIPTCGWSRETSISGLLLSYGPDQVEMVRHTPTLVEKILRGAKPADLPVLQPTRFQLIVNEKTAKALKITIPGSILLRADEVIA
jgi:putative ABC transport system substrate-binding protein